MIILYTSVCPCVIRSVDTVKSFATSRNIDFDKRRVSYNETYRKEANEIGEELPFLYNEDNSKTISAYNVSEEKLEWLIK